MKNLKLSKIASSTLWQVAGRGVTAAVSFLVVSLLGKILGAEGFGDFAKAFALIETFYILTDFGLNAIFVKSAIGSQAKINYFFGQLFSLRLVMALAVILAIFLIVIFLPYNPEQNLGFSNQVKLGAILASTAIATYSIFLTAQAVFQLRLSFKKQFLAQITGGSAKIVAVLTAVLIKPTFLTAIAAVLVGELMLSTAALFLASQTVGQFKLIFNFSKFRQFFLRAAPIGFSLIFNLLYFRGDLIILSIFRTSAEVGNYSLAYKFFEALLVLPIFFVNASFPIMMKSFIKDPKLLAKSVSQYSYLLFATSIVATVILFWVGPAIIGLIFGQSFALSQLTLQILSLGLPFFYLSAIYMWSLVTIGYQKILLPIYGVGAAVNLLFNSILIPIWGAAAAAVITVISEAAILLALYTSYLVFKRRVISET